ncbi:hypothetical protein [Deinococcus alpinitundrae]|uniref:hypothetical protein n=1 Tax=Deinococcus alpinitundrae TaxID=468913 RepID=UPI00137B29EC|nr:hypothetical protein [Deinococcus alpinitundrae]
MLGLALGLSSPGSCGPGAAFAAPSPAASTIFSRQGAPFVVELRLRGKTLNAGQRATLQAAANRVAGLIGSGFQPVRLDLPANACDKGLPALHERFTHFVAFVAVKDLGDDVYGDSSPCDLHDKTYLPIYGSVDLNSRGLNDLSQPELLDTIIHELLHALGIGTLWTADERVSLDGGGDEKNLAQKERGQWYYTGPRALAAYRALGGQGTGILLDPDAGHWAGEVVCSEILSGSAGDVTDRVNPVSSITLGALEDLGYRVNTKLGDRYALPKGDCPTD